ncbi:OmpA family protein [Rhodococcus zopfii]
MTASTVILGLTTACGHSEAPQARSATDSVVIVSGSHANAPVPTLNDETSRLVEDALTNGGSVDIVKVSGRPEVVDLALGEVKGTDAGREAQINGNLTRIRKELAVGVETDGADTWEALSMATDLVRGSRATHPVIVFTGSGIGDTGRLAFTEPGMLTASPEDVGAYLEQTGALPDLSGITVVLVGIGYAALPQQPLDAALRSNVIAIWRYVLEKAGASVVVSPDPRTGDPVETTATVHTVTVPTIAPPTTCSTQEIVFNQQSKVSFVAEQDTFVDAAAASEALGPIAGWLSAGSDRTALVRGTTTDDRGDRNRLRALGQKRADTVTEFLVSHGASPAQITSVGVGADFPEYVRPDADETGLLLPGPAAVNRSVRLTLTDPC